MVLPYRSLDSQVDSSPATSTLNTEYTIWLSSSFLFVFPSPPPPLPIFKTCRSFSYSFYIRSTLFDHPFFQADSSTSQQLNSSDSQTLVWSDPNSFLNLPHRPTLRLDHIGIETSLAIKWNAMTIITDRLWAPCLFIQFLLSTFLTSTRPSWHMARINHGHAAFHLEHRNPKPSPLGLMTAQLPSLSRRDNTCGKDDKAVQCAKPADSNNITIPVVLAVV